MKQSKKLDVCLFAVLGMIMPLIVGLCWNSLNINERWISSILVVVLNIVIVIGIYHSMPSEGPKPDIRKEDIDGVIDILKEWSDGFKEEK